MTASQSQPARDVFASGAYLREYYATLGHENREVGAFLHRVASRRGGLKVLDAGCGPTLLYWASFMPGASELHGFDLNPANIKANRSAIDEVLRGVVDPGLAEAAGYGAALCGAPVSAEVHAAATAKRVGTLKVADLGQAWPYDGATFDLVLSCFALEQLPDWTMFEAALAQAHRVLVPGGQLALVSGAQGTCWNCDDQSFPTLFVTASDLRARLGACGFVVSQSQEIASTDTEWRDQGYSRVLLTLASKAAG
jgi:SAM-dependent methyltransferase